MENFPKPICIVGTTASGKTELSIKLAEHFLSENKEVAIISLDAFQIYKGMDIGTGKIDLTIYPHIPHFGIDVVDASENFSVAKFLRYSTKIKDSLHKETQIIYVGGTGLYVNAIVDGFEFPPQDKSVRKKLEDRFRDNCDNAYRELEKKDIKAAKKIDPRNIRRTLRALEVIEISGKRFSDFRTTYDQQNSTANFFGLYQTRETGRKYIDIRVKKMFESGWIEESQKLIKKDISITASKAIGYSQIIDFLKEENDCDKDELIEMIVNKTVKFSRRQRMWFKKDTRIKWIFGNYENSIDELVNYIKEEIKC